jgi:hypothetical protein
MMTGGLASETLYVPRGIRERSTAAEVGARRDRLFEIVHAHRPMTVRQVYYRATVLGLVEKTEAGYAKIKTDLKIMRENATLPYYWLADSTRWQRKPLTFNSVEDALQNCAKTYRKSLWQDSDSYIEVWCEKDALAGVIYPITSKYDIPLMVARGYASLSFLYSAAQAIKSADDAGKEVFIYHLGDYDPSGQDAARDIEEKLRDMSGVDLTFERLAVTPEQIEEWDLPTRPNKNSDRRTIKFTGEASVELDAIEPGQLRQLIENAIQQHIDQDELDILLEAEKSEREGMRAWIGTLPGDSASF